MSAGYLVDIPDHVRETIDDLPDRDFMVVFRRLHRLQLDPWAGDVRRLQVRGEVEFRVRAGDYRIVYTVDEERRIVQVKQVGLRRDVYRRR